jgi:RNA polymerase primary sigma factor
MSVLDSVKGKALNPLLRMAALAGVVSVVRMHISRGDDFDARDGAGMTPLMLAASKNRASVCATLIEAGADLGLCDPSGRAALSIACEAGAREAAEVLSVALTRPKPEDELLHDDGPEPPVWLELVSLDDDWEAGSLGDWEVDEAKAPPEGDLSIVEEAAALYRSISLHVPIDNAEDWSDFDAILPDEATRPKVGEELRDGLRLLLLRAIREGRVSEQRVLRLCSKDGEQDEDTERIIRALLSEIGALLDEDAEDGDDLLLEEPTGQEEDELTALLEYADDLDPWRCDPARVYSREMRIGRLLTAEEEVVLGKEMEQGLELAIKALSTWIVGLDALEKDPLLADFEESTEAPLDLSSLEVSSEEAEVAIPFTSFEDEEEDTETSGQEVELPTLSEEMLQSRREGWTGSVTDLMRLKKSSGVLLKLADRAVGDPEANAFRKAVERYAKARETMTVCNLRLVYSVVKRYQGHGLMLDDLVQEGNIGLMKAVERYDWRRGFKFSTYATWWIRQSAHRALADKGRTIRLPVHMNEKLVGVSRAADAYELENGSAPSDTDLAEFVSISVERMSKIRAWMEEPKCVHDKDNDGVLWEDKLFDTPEHRPDFMDENDALRNVLKRGLVDIDDERAAEIISLRFGLDGSDSRTLEEVGEIFGLTRERIRQIEDKAIRRLAHPSRSAALAPFYYPYKYSQHSKRVSHATDDPSEPAAPTKHS